MKLLNAARFERSFFINSDRFKLIKISVVAGLLGQLSQKNPASGRPRNRIRHGATYTAYYGGNGRGAWWNAGASHMNVAYPKRYFNQMRLVSLQGTQQRFQCVK